MSTIEFMNPAQTLLSEIKRDDTLLLEMITHCLQAEWTSELQQDILTFDLHIALSFIGP